MSTKAEVETLTAEVKTLVVCNRQITLSVARQLDEVKPWELSHVFGRVRFSKNDDNPYVIGKQKITNALVVSNIGIMNQDRTFKTLLGHGYYQHMANEFADFPEDKLFGELKFYVEMFYRQPLIVLAGLK